MIDGIEGSYCKRKRVMLTGAGGAIGVHIFSYIMEKTDWDVVLTDSFNPEHKGYFDRITTVMQPEWKDRVTVITHDLVVPFSSRQIKKMGEIDYIVNLASRSDVQNSIDDPTPFALNNTQIILTMLELARVLKPKKFIHFSTDEVYGSAPKESHGHKEWSCIIPSNPYSASKAAQEAYAIGWWRSFDVPLILTNTMNNFGEMQAPSKFPAMIQQKIDRGETIPIHATKDGNIGSRYYIHSRNTADAILFILKNVEPIMHGHGEIDLPERLNIVGDKQVDNLELVQTIGRLMGKEPKHEMVNFHENNPGHDLHYGLDGTKLKEMGWTSPMSFEESLKQTIEWQQNHPEWL